MKTDEIMALVSATKALLNRDQRNTCQHEETHRGGAIWEVCNSCGAKWADDEGGKPEWVDPPEWSAGYDAIDKIEAALKEREAQSFDEARSLGVFKTALPCCPTWYAKELRKEGWNAAIRTAPQKAVLNGWPTDDDVRDAYRKAFGKIPASNLWANLGIFAKALRDMPSPVSAAPPKAQPMSEWMPLPEPPEAERHHGITGE